MYLRRATSRHDRHLSLNGKALRAIPINAHHHSSWLTLRLRFNLPQPGVSIIRAAPQLTFAVALSAYFDLDEYQ